MKTLLQLAFNLIFIFFSASAVAEHNINCFHEEIDDFGKNLPRAEAIKIKSSKKPSNYRHQSDYLLISCIDFRLNDEVSQFMQKRGLTDNYDTLVLAGASLGVYNKQYPEWEKTFLDHLKLVVDLHKVKGVIIIDHRNCALYKKLLGSEIESSRERETEVHRAQFLEVREVIYKNYPQLKVEFLLMDLDGSVETVEAFTSKKDIECFEKKY